MLDEKTLELKMGQIESHLQSLVHLVPTLEKVASESQTVRDYVIDKITKFALSLKTARLDKDELNGFFEHPYVIWQERKDKPGEWHIAIPKIFSSINLGWLDKVTSSHNIFLVNRFSEWFGEIPALLKKELNLQDPLDIKLTADKKHVVGSDIEKAQEKYGRFITKRDGDKLEIDQTRYFQFLANLIDDGILPFSQSPIPESHLRKEKLTKFELRPYQQNAIDTLKKYGHIGVYYPPSTGKTFIGMDAICEIKVERKRWLIVVPRTTLIEQWQENLTDFTSLDNSEYVIVTYQTAIKKFMEEEFTGMIVDESHHMPSDYFVHLSKIKCHYIIGLTATPQREDGREDYIVALTGQPVGLSWDYFRTYGIIQSPESHIWIVKNEEERMARLRSIIHSDNKVTLIFSTYLKMGEEIKKEIGCEFVHGQTPDKLKKLREEIATKGICCASGIANEGVSLKTIQRVIEMSWNFGSRHEELQRMTRVLHAADKKTPGIHHVIMTPEEWNHDHKRFWSSMDRGFKIVLHREGFDEKVFDLQQKQNIKRSRSDISPRRSPADRAQKRAGLSSVQKINDHPALKLTAIQQVIGLLTTKEKECLIEFRTNPHKAYSKAEMCSKVGGVRVRDFASFKKLEFHKLIKEVKPERYRAV